MYYVHALLFSNKRQSDEAIVPQLSKCPKFGAVRVD